MSLALTSHDNLSRVCAASILYNLRFRRHIRLVIDVSTKRILSAHVDALASASQARAERRVLDAYLKETSRAALERSYKLLARLMTEQETAGLLASAPSSADAVSAASIIAAFPQAQALLPPDVDAGFASEQPIRRADRKVCSS